MKGCEILIKNILNEKTENNIITTQDSVQK